MSEFLDRVQKASDFRDHDRTLEAIRGVFYALLLGAADGDARAAASHLPDDLETLWKPALFACLREGEAPGSPLDGEAFADRVRRRVPGLEGERVERVARAVLGELRELVPADGRFELAGGLPVHLRDDWIG